MRLGAPTSCTCLYFQLNRCSFVGPTAGGHRAGTEQPPLPPALLLLPPPDPLGLLGLTSALCDS